MQKEFLPYDTVRNNALKLAHKIYNEGFIPDVIYVSLRGGAYLGNIISEYYKILRKGERPTYYAAVVARSYTDVASADEVVHVDGWTYSPDYLRSGDKVLLIDDIFDTGRTINHLAKIIIDRGVPRRDLKIAVHDFKYFYDKAVQPTFLPDYWCRQHKLSEKDEPRWIHYLSHELVGLDKEDLEKNYYSQDNELREVLSILGKK
jgi:hypoxanthine phosphoribosyltransferase